MFSCSLGPSDLSISILAYAAYYIRYTCLIQLNSCSVHCCCSTIIFLYAVCSLCIVLLVNVHVFYREFSIKTDLLALHHLIPMQRIVSLAFQQHPPHHIIHKRNGRKQLTTIHGRPYYEKQNQHLPTDTYIRCPTAIQPSLTEYRGLSYMLTDR